MNIQKINTINNKVNFKGIYADLQDSENYGENFFDLKNHIENITGEKSDTRQSLFYVQKGLENTKDYQKYLDFLYKKGIKDKFTGSGDIFYNEKEVKIMVRKLSALESAKRNDTSEKASAAAEALLEKAFKIALKAKKITRKELNKSIEKFEQNKIKRLQKLHLL